MTNVSWCYAVIFILLVIACVFIFGIDIAFLARLERSAQKRKKTRIFKKQSEFRRKLVKVSAQSREIIEYSQMPKLGYVFLTIGCAFVGFMAGRLVYSSFIVSLTVSVFGLIAPLLFFSFRRTKSQSERLNKIASSMMILSNSYIVTEDFITTVKDDVDTLDYPEPFRDFLTYVTFIDSDISTGLRRMEAQVNNVFFSQWVDALILAQSDRALKYVAVSVVESMHDVLQVQQESDAAMYAVWRDYGMTLVLIFSVPLIFKFLLADAYVVLTTSVAGQGLFILLLLSVIYSVFRALKINRPLMV